MNIYPFFLECSQRCLDNEHKQKVFQNLAFGQGGHIIERKDKQVLVTGSDEFVIPFSYTQDAHSEVDQKLWNQHLFDEAAEHLKKTQTVWSAIRKKNKTNLLFRHIASLDQTKEKKEALCSLIILAFFLKLLKSSDVVYDGVRINKLSDDILACNLRQRITEGVTHEEREPPKGS
jgi:hypothetical protein